jgi:hypothetical protein
MPDKCSVCGGEITATQTWFWGAWFYLGSLSNKKSHSRASDCLAARTRKCAEILNEQIAAMRCGGGMTGDVEMARNRIRREYPEAFKDSNS